ncbi:MAG: GWxTD domain-containing protein [bacterium]|nr:GWxTD domain-containing protein [bacterium]
MFARGQLHNNYRGRLRLIVRLYLLICILLPAASASALTATGEFITYLDLYSSPLADGSTSLVLYAQLPVANLSWHESGDSLIANLHVTWSFNSSGESVVAIDEDVDLVRPLIGSEGLQSMYYIREVQPPAGIYRLEFTCEDKGRKIGGLFGGLFGHYPAASLTSRVVVRDFSAGGILADLLPYSIVGENLFSRPNPSGAYLIGDPHMEIRTCFTPPANREGYFSLILKVEDRFGNICFRSKGGWKYESEILPLQFRIPIAGLEAGEYKVKLVLGGEDVQSAEYSYPLMIVGSLDIDDKELAQRSIEAQLLLGNEAYNDWLRLPAWNRVEVMTRFWHDRDPNPSTEENEIYEEFLSRYSIAMEKFTVFQPGPLTDRGRIMIRYGEPDIFRQEIMPLNKEALVNEIRGLHGGTSEDQGQDVGLDSRNSDLGRDLNSVGMGASFSMGGESEPYEYWAYDLEGDPLLPEFKLNLSGVGLKLIFADRFGYGEYRLLYRSEDFDF